MKKYLTIKEVAKELDIHASTARRWISAGKLIPLQYPGKRLRFNKEYIKSLTGTETSQKENLNNGKKM